MDFTLLCNLGGPRNASVPLRLRLLHVWPAKSPGDIRIYNYCTLWVDETGMLIQGVSPTLMAIGFRRNLSPCVLPAESFPLDAYEFVAFSQLNLRADEILQDEVNGWALIDLLFIRMVWTTPGVWSSKKSRWNLGEFMFLPFADDHLIDYLCPYWAALVWYCLILFRYYRLSEEGKYPSSASDFIRFSCETTFGVDEGVEFTFIEADWRSNLSIKVAIAGDRLVSMHELLLGLSMDLRCTEGSEESKSADLCLRFKVIFALVAGYL
ncbi:unnamed protein product [Linum trigynum]|uniref:Aminotransferase-like plant mobile domain-containing protein n=1 Tax=Linum trigynum TaxID=586398 RepID=A0AAV2GS04_9ROSI